MPPVATPPHEAIPLIDELLAQERTLTAVERFSQWHGRHAPLPRSHSAPSPQAPADRTYRRLLPIRPPSPGEQYAFEVDLDRCSGCKACVTACHALNGLEDGETWRSVGLLVGAPEPAATTPALLQHVTTACHHCLEPACHHGCPVLAYDKDPATGVVRHLDDQCIGCTYCIMMCPYEVPRYSRRLGIVRKCDMCSGRLAAGEAPACAQACPTEAIRITNVRPREILSRLLPPPRPSDRRQPANPFLPSSPNPALTLPTTLFRTRRLDPARMRHADAEQATPAHGHAPLVAMLVLTQAAVGVLSWRPWLPATVQPLAVGLALAALILGLAASVFHLGQPSRAWRVFLGLRRSWLSREAVLLGALLMVTVASALLPPEGLAARTASLLAALMGWGFVLASSMVYVATRRSFWSASLTFPRFAGTTVALGSVLVGAIPHLPAPWQFLASVGAVMGLGLSLAAEFRLASQRDPAASTALSRSATLLTGPLRLRWYARLGFAAAGVATVAAAWVTEGPTSAISRGLALLFLILSALLERHLFFTAASPDRMPGNVPA